MRVLWTVLAVWTATSIIVAVAWAVHFRVQRLQEAKRMTRGSRDQ